MVKPVLVVPLVPFCLQKLALVNHVCKTVLNVLLSNLVNNVKMEISLLDHVVTHAILNALNALVPHLIVLTVPKASIINLIMVNVYLAQNSVQLAIQQHLAKLALQDSI